MFGLFESREKKMRDNASNWLELARKVWNYRRDVLSTAEARDLQARTEELRVLLKARADAGKLKLAIESLELVLKRTGGAHYPKSSLGENVEFFLVAAIVIFGIRTYFFQPFKIPTNSMWPTYYGMTAEVLPTDGTAPGILGQALRLAVFGAQRRTIVAPRTGEVSAPVVMNQGVAILAYTVKAGRSWFVLPAKVKEYTLYVDGIPASIQVPVDFNDFDQVFVETFFPNRAAFNEAAVRARDSGQAERVRFVADEEQGSSYEATLVPLGRKAKQGDPVLRFDLMAGDQLFVDRISYHFVRPTPGQGFVFRTGNIPGIASFAGDQYYIKRLAGVPGDRVEIRDPVLYRNGRPSDGAEAFRLNAAKTPPYRGYSNAVPDNARFMQLFPGETITVPEHGYLALGDNSHNSFDGRYWGFVPEKDVVGRPLFIYYPFSRRWGPAH